MVSWQEYLTVLCVQMIEGSCSTSSSMLCGTSLLSILVSLQGQMVFGQLLGHYLALTLSDSFFTEVSKVTVL